MDEAVRELVDCILAHVPREHWPRAVLDVHYDRAFQALLEAGPRRHVHRCPVCRTESSCGCEECRPTLENAAGEPMVIKTCPACVEQLGRESTGEQVHIPGYTRAVY